MTALLGIARRALLVAAVTIVAGAAAAQANSLVLCGWYGCQLLILGPRTPNPRSSPHMRFHIRPSRVRAGGTLRATARGFLPHEYVTIWDYWGRRWKRSSHLLGGWATARGTLTFYRETFGTNITPLGRHKICLQGERSRRVACAVYRVLSAGPAIGPGFVAPGSSSSPSPSPSPGSGSSPSGSTSPSSSPGTSGWTPPTVGPGLGT